MASELSKITFDAAIEGLEDLDEMSYKDSTVLMQLLKDNLAMWRDNEMTEDADYDAEIPVNEN